MLFDPLYMLVMGLGLLLSLGAQAWVKSTTSRWSQVPIGRGMTGADVAAGPASFTHHLIDNKLAIIIEPLTFLKFLIS